MDHRLRAFVFPESRAAYEIRVAGKGGQFAKGGGRVPGKGGGKAYPPLEAGVKLAGANTLIGGAFRDAEGVFHTNSWEQGDGGFATQEAWQKARDRYVVADTPTLQMNAALRGEMEMSSGLKQRVSEAKKLTAAKTVEDSTVHRVIALSPHKANAMTVGAEFESKGFMSSQSGSKSGYGIHRRESGKVNVGITIRVPAGTHAGDVGYGEIVLRPSRMRVVSVTQGGQRAGDMEVEMELLSEL